MKIPKPILLVLTAFLALAAYVPRAQAYHDDDDSYGYFYDNLSPYGEWVQTDSYGYCWHPSNVDDDWAPYTDGYWAYTDGGWTWVSYEDFGGITYHYGRWTRLSDVGWVWVPGSEWAPAWVSWRYSDDYVGWAPLPPEAHWRAGIGFGVWADTAYDIGPGCYSFVTFGNFCSPALRGVLVSRDQNVTIIQNTANITNITENNGNVYVGGPSYDALAARSSRAIPVLKLDRESGAAALHAAGGKNLAHTQGNQLVVLAPKITPPAKGEHLAPPKVARTITDAKADHGWSAVKDPAEREKLQADLKAQDKGATPDSAPAHAVTAEETKLPTVTKGKGEVAAEATAEPSPKSKSKKGKTPSETEEAAAEASPTPKSKSKKSKTPSETAEGYAAEASPTPKKSKKSKTPESEAEAEKTPKNSNLQPFLSSDEEQPKKSEKSDADQENSDKYEEHSKPKSTPSGEEVSAQKTPKAKSKKPKEEGPAQPTPY